MIDPERKARMLARLAPQPAPPNPLPDLGSEVASLAVRGKLRHLLVGKTPKGYQASFMNDDGSCRVDIRADPVEAILVAIGAVSTLDMNLRNRGRS